MKKILKNTYFLAFVLSISIWCFFKYNYKIYKISGDSMHPTILNSEWVLAEKNFNPERYDVVAINDSEGDKLVKRIIAMPNEKVEIKNGFIYVNDKMIEDSFGIGRISYYLVDDDDNLLTYWSGPNIGRPVVKFANHSPVTLSSGEYYYIGDHRSISVYGVVKKINIVGKIIAGF